MEIWIAFNIGFIISSLFWWSKYSHEKSMKEFHWEMIESYKKEMEFYRESRKEWIKAYENLKGEI